MTKLDLLATKVSIKQIEDQIWNALRNNKAGNSKAVGGILSSILNEPLEYLKQNFKVGTNNKNKK